MFFQKRKFILGFVLGIIFFIPIFAQAANLGEERSFNIQLDYDLSGSAKTDTQLIKITNRLYFYVNKQWFNNLTVSNKNEINNKLYDLGNEFEYRIYPILTQSFGFEDNPGIDNDSRIIVVLHQMKTTIGGYMQAEDNYSSQIYPRSNEGQVVYLNADHILPLSLNNLSYHLAHEFMHLITLKQNPNEEVWLNEARAEYTEVLLGYEKNWVNSNLHRRVQQFLNNTSISLLNWDNTNYDYAKVNLLTQYLVEHYGLNILVDSLHSSKVGVDAINYALQKNGFSEDFSNIFMDWLITNVVNDCSVSEKYCYTNSYLENFTVFPYTYYLPAQSKSSLSVTDSLKSWNAKWQKIAGGSGVIKLKFTIPEQTPIFKIPYIIEGVNNKKIVGYLDFSSINIQEAYIEGIGSKNKAVYFIPFVGSNGQENNIYYYSWEASTLEKNAQIEQQVIDELLGKIEFLKREIAKLQLQLAMIKTNQSNQYCSVFSGDLYYGITSPEVKCLQQFLSNLGTKIYPEGLVTGYFGPLTQAAVKRYQALQGIIATGYFGTLTRAAVNNKL
jgi:peptidoglycan hydrolase-like protein with peptidoglycan-binding domain